MSWDLLSTETLLLVVFAALLAVLASQVRELRASVGELRENLLDVKQRLGDAQYLVKTLGDAGAEQKPRPPRAPESDGSPVVQDPEPVQPRAPHQPEPQPPAKPRQDGTERPPQKQAKPRPGSPFHDAARELYRRWCVEDRRPVPTAPIEIGYLRYAGDQRTSELSPSMHVFSDDQQTGEFVRFSAAGTDKGLAFPNPDAFFNETVHRILYPALTADAFNNHRMLAATPPVPIQRQPDGKWQKVS